METFKIELTQTNGKGNVTFQASANGINVASESNLALEIANFTKDTIILHERLSKRGLKGLSRARIKSSQALNCKITSVIDDMSISFSINNFGNFAKETTEKNLVEVIDLIINHNSKFAHLWA